MLSSAGGRDRPGRRQGAVLFLKFRETRVAIYAAIGTDVCVYENVSLQSQAYARLRVARPHSLYLAPVARGVLVTALQDATYVVRRLFGPGFASKHCVPLLGIGQGCAQEALSWCGVD